MAGTKDPSGTVIARNRRARRDYMVEEVLEAGIVLTGTEVKSLRLGRASINEAYATPQGAEIVLINAHVPDYAPAGRFNHEPRRIRKLLLHKREVRRLMGAVQRDGMTLVPLSLYFNDRGLAKVEIALAKGRRDVDKRHLVRDRDWQRQKARLLRARG